MASRVTSQVAATGPEKDEVELLVAPDQIGVEDLVVGDDRHRHDRIRRTSANVATSRIG